MYYTYTFRHGIYPKLYLNNRSLPPVKRVLRTTNKYLDILTRSSTYPAYAHNSQSPNTKWPFPTSSTVSNFWAYETPQQTPAVWIPAKAYMDLMWGATKISDINHIQWFQSKVLRTSFKAPYCRVSNCTLHSYLKTPCLWNSQNSLQTF